MHIHVLEKKNMHLHTFPDMYTAPCVHTMTQSQPFAPSLHSTLTEMGCVTKLHVANELLLTWHAGYPFTVVVVC